MDDNRIIELEIKAAYQEDLLQALNRTVAAQQKEIQRLQATCRLLHERVQGLTESVLEQSHQPALEKPPHY